MVWVVLRDWSSCERSVYERLAENLWTPKFNGDFRRRNFLVNTSCVCRKEEGTKDDGTFVQPIWDNLLSKSNQKHSAFLPNKNASTI